MQTLVQHTVDSFAPVTLDELKLRAALSTRLDTKYVVTWPAFASVLEALLDEFRVLEIAGRRTFQYQTAYFDTESLTLYQAHVQGRRKRFKCRSRHYVDSGLHLFEMKMKGLRSQTVKRQMAYDPAHALLVTAEASQFVRDCLIEQYGQPFDEELALSLRNSYRRMTLLAREGAERLTCDFDLSFEGPNGRSGRLASDFIVLEAKSMDGNGLADRTLRGIGARSLACSKYCVGTAMLRPDVKANDFRWLLHRYFESDATTSSLSPEPYFAEGRHQSAERLRTSAASSGAVRAADQIAAVIGTADLETSPAPELQRSQPNVSRRRVSLTVTWRLSQATTVVAVNAASAYEVCKLTNPGLWLALIAGMSLARVESGILWRLHHRKPVRATS